MSATLQSASGLQTWKLTLAYDGTDFRGWQVQPEAPTVQGEVQSALERITGEAPLPQGSGRTDAGVHALAQVASFALHAPIPAANLQRALNRTLPASIRVLAAQTMPDTFHARHGAKAKTYEYRIFRGEICPPFLARYVYACPWPLDEAALDAAARMFVGEHDFLSFAASDPDLTARRMQLEGDGEASEAAGTVRRIFASAWERRQIADGELLVYRVRGNGFLHHMVRNFVGTLLDVGRGRLIASAIPEIIAARARAAAGPTAPARGLFLHSVEYGDRKLSTSGLLV
ncbi:MAG: tRNA pseudouridine(38-40) synthase TruA [Terriglobia bacterium]|nr:tRNA pseudouridine(38-40) synthase TruA [Terriglobia bacterium]